MATAEADIGKQETALFTELGSSGLKRYGGIVREEFLPKLQGSRAVKVFREMADNDPVAGAILFAIDMLIRQVEWRVEPGGRSREDEDAAAFLTGALDDMSNSWEDTVSEILSFLPMGWSYHEIVYKRREGDSRDPGRRSKFTDGRIGWRKLPIRAQETLLEWEFDEEGGVQAMLQLPPPDFERKRIPIEKALLFRTSVHKGNPHGKSVLRNAYIPWYFKREIERIEAIGIERDLAGLPKATAPPEWFGPNAKPEEKAALEELKRIVRDIRRDEQEGVAIPAIYDGEGNKLMDIELMSTGGRRQIDIEATIERYDRRIAMTVLADFILLGHEKVGSFALASSKTEIFATALSAWVGSIAGIFNRHAIPRLFGLNGFRLAALPELVPGDIETVDLEALAQYITALAGAGAPLFPDEDLERHLREQAGLPAAAEGEM